MRIRLVLLLFVTLLSTPISLYAQANDPEPSINDFIDVEKEPQPLTPIESHVVYPEQARRAGLEGKVELSALIEKDGSVSKVVVQKSDYDVFKTSAINAMKATRFTPAMQDGKPTRVWMSQTISFKLTDPAQESEEESGDENPFIKLMAVGPDSMRLALQSIGELSDQTNGDIRTMSAAASDSLSHGKTPAYMTVVYDHSGAKSMIVGYRHVEPEEFRSFQTMTFGDARHWTMSAEFDHMFMDMTVDSPTRSYEMKIRRK